MNSKNKQTFSCKKYLNDKFIIKMTKGNKNVYLALFSLFLLLHIITYHNDFKNKSSINSRNLLGFGSIFGGINTKTLKPIIRKHCFDKVKNKIVSKEHPLVFACAGIGKMRTSFRIAPSNSATQTMLNSDQLIIQTAYGNNCLYPPNIALLTDPCLTKFSKECSVSNYILNVEQGPGCIIVYCDNIFDECHINADIQIFKQVNITQDLHNILSIGDAVFSIKGTGFAFNPTRNKVKCIDDRNDEIECQVMNVNEDANKLEIYTDHPFGRESFGYIYVKINVEDIGWSDWTIVATVTDPWPLKRVQIIIMISGIVIGLLVCSMIIWKWYKNNIERLIYQHTEFAKAMHELDDKEEALRFEGYFTGIVQNWKPENAMKSTSDDKARAEVQKQQRENEKKLLLENGIVFR